MQRPSVLFLGLVLGLPVLASAQTTPANLVGTWEEVRPTPPAPKPGASLTDRENRTYRSLTFRPDGTWLETTIWISRGDTLVQNAKWSTTGWKGDTLVPGKGDENYRTISTVQGDRLTWKRLYMNSTADSSTYKRIDIAKRPFSPQVIAAGFGAGRPVAHPQPPTGTIADLVGAWEAIPESYKDRKQIIRYFRIYRSDSTSLDIMTVVRGSDTLSHVVPSEGWGSWTRQTGDSLIKGSGAYKKIVLRDQLLSFQAQGFEAPSFRAIDWPKRP